MVFFCDRLITVMIMEIRPTMAYLDPRGGGCATCCHEPVPSLRPSLSVGAAGPPGFSLQNKIRNILLQIQVKDIPETIIKTAYFNPEP